MVEDRFVLIEVFEETMVPYLCDFCHLFAVPEKAEIEEVREDVCVVQGNDRSDVMLDHLNRYLLEQLIDILRFVADLLQFLHTPTYKRCRIFIELPLHQISNL